MIIVCVIWYAGTFPIGTMAKVAIDANFNKKPNSAKKRPEKSQTDCLKASKKPNFVALLFICHKETSELHEHHSKFSLKFRLSLAWPCIRVHDCFFSKFSWFVRLHTLGAMVPQMAYNVYSSIGSFLHL